jgi:hypothetical protein
MYSLETLERLNSQVTQDSVGKEDTIHPVGESRKDNGGQDGVELAPDTVECETCGCRFVDWPAGGSHGSRWSACAGAQLFPTLHEDISKKQQLLWSEKLSDSDKEQIIIEILYLRAKFKALQRSQKSG